MVSWKTRNLTFFLLLVLLFSVLCPYQVGAVNPQLPVIQVFIDGLPLILDTPPIIEQGRTLVPLRAIFEALGATVEWNQADQSITAFKGNVSLFLQIGSRDARKNNIPVTLDVPARIVNGRTLVPLRFIGEALGADVYWDSTAQKIDITSESVLPPAQQEPEKPSQPDLTPLYPGVHLLLPDWVKSGLTHSFVEKEYDSALIYTDILAVKPLNKISLITPNLLDITAKNPYMQNMYKLIFWGTGCDYSPYLTFTGNQGGAGGCIGRSIIHVMDILKEREHPYTPDLSFWYLHARQEELAKGGPPDTAYVLEHNGICTEASMPSDYDKAKLMTDAQGKKYVDFSAMKQPSFATNLEASLYKVIYGPPTEPTEENIRYLLKNYGPLVAAGPLTIIQGENPKQPHAVTIVGYDDIAKTVKCLNSWGDTWGPNGNGFFNVPYDKLEENFKYVRYLENIPSDRTGTSYAYTARIHVQTGGTSRNKLTVKVGVFGKDPVTVWDTPNETFWTDYSKTLCIDVKLPDYAKNHWPPTTENRWYVQIINNSNSDTAEVKEITFARLYKNPDGSFATETFKSSETGTKIEAGKSKLIYVPTPPSPIIMPLTPIIQLVPNI